MHVIISPIKIIIVIEMVVVLIITTIKCIIEEEKEEMLRMAIIPHSATSRKVPTEVKDSADGVIVETEKDSSVGPLG